METNMGVIVKRYSRALSVTALSVTLLVPQLSFAQTGEVTEEPSALAMFGDAAIARPLGLALTVIGAATFLVTLPFSALGGNVGEAGKVLVVGPAEATFVRCLGCSQSGYKHDVVDSSESTASAEPAPADE
jgi:hypothetical protein